MASAGNEPSCRSGRDAHSTAGICTRYGRDMYALRPGYVRATAGICTHHGRDRNAGTGPPWTPEDVLTLKEALDCQQPISKRICGNLRHLWIKKAPRTTTGSRGVQICMADGVKRRKNPSFCGLRACVSAKAWHSNASRPQNGLQILSKKIIGESWPRGLQIAKGGLQ